MDNDILEQMMADSRKRVKEGRKRYNESHERIMEIFRKLNCLL